MKAVVFKGVGNIAIEEVSDPIIKDPTDVIVKITTSAICGTDLHMIRGTIPGMIGDHFFSRGTILGHEGIGIVEQVGNDVHHFKVGDRVIIPSTVSCGSCDYCTKEIYAQCDKANPHGPDAGTVFFGGPPSSGPLDGLQAEKARIPFADTTLLKLPANISDEQAILVSDILPTAYMAVEMVDIQKDDTVAVFGCGPVGQLAIGILKHLNIHAIFAIDNIPSRLSMAHRHGAHTINFDEEDPVISLKKLTNGRGPTKIIDAVGIDAEQACQHGINFFKNFAQKQEFKKELKEIAPKTNPHDGNWIPGNGPSQVLQWAVKAIAKAGTLSIIGVYTPLLNNFPIGMAMNKNLTLRMGNCNHRKYIPMLLKLVHEGKFNPVPYITHIVPFHEAIHAYKHFDKRQDDWIKVILTMP